jgi:hypothetical protein
MPQITKNWVVFLTVGGVIMFVLALYGQREHRSTDNRNASDWGGAPPYQEANVEQYCRNEWTKRGELNTQMYSHCAQKEKDGYDKMATVIRDHSDFDWVETLMPKIWEQWSKRGVTHYSMVAYCLDKEIEAFKDYNYERKQVIFDSGKMSSCESQWRQSESRWSMTVYCYKRD